ncbi:iron complex transport system permease protein [Fontibacillus solani]|uniref:Iron complex transport system permease protein n=1 Tax=Fontibacillus solani TaxID=1572857 RepID=A0A7W3STL6_9BACL|nr:iron ABC transporter permease [Fontibacillus solani]MBA9086040.1 iron complex transport system permease protein [Fontibacillus solani]
MAKTGFGRYATTIFVFLGLTLIAGYFHITNGSFEMSVMDVLKTLLRIDSNPKYDLVIFEFRLPRIVIAAIVGIGLGIAGTVIQGVTRNGLADPGILGINAGAGAAIVAFMFFFQMADINVLGGTSYSIMMMPLFGFVGGALAAIVIYVFSWRNGSLDMQRLILTGIAISSGFGALSLYISLKMNAQDFEMAAVWSVGSIYSANWLYVLAALPWVVILGTVIYRKSYLLNYFQLEESSVKSLGIAVEKEKSILLLCSIGIVSACVSVSGSIGFIGLMAPHIAKRLVGLNHRYVLPTSAVIGMFLLVISDYFAKTVFAPSELPVGIVVSLIGIPYFLYLLAKAKA